MGWIEEDIARYRITGQGVTRAKQILDPRLDYDREGVKKAKFGNMLSAIAILISIFFGLVALFFSCRALISTQKTPTPPVTSTPLVSFQVAPTPTSPVLNDSLFNPNSAIVEPYCSMFKDSPDYVYVEEGQPVTLKWRWDASSEPQIWDHIYAANYEIFLDDQRIYADSRSEIEYLSDEGWYRVSWYADVGVLAPGKHRAERFLSWNRKIDDGWKWYGPGGDIVTERHYCDIIVR